MAGVIKVFLIACALCIAILPAYAQTKVTLSLRHVSFEKLLDTIKQQTHYRFVYNPDNLPKKTINVKVKNQEVLAVLDKQLNGTGYIYTCSPIT
jgi:predicted transcriptional regulator